MKKYDNSLSIPLGMFFRVELQIQKLVKAKKWPSSYYQFPDLVPLITSYEHPSFALGYDDDGLHFFVSADVRSKPKMSLEKWRAFDSLELFIDSKGLHNARTKHKNWFHCILFPEAIEGVTSRLFKFNGEKSDNCLSVTSECDLDEIRYDVMIPWTLLEGFEYQETTFLGFGFRLNRSNCPTLSFPVASTLIEKMPSLLSRCEVK